MFSKLNNNKTIQLNNPDHSHLTSFSTVGNNFVRQSQQSGTDWPQFAKCSSESTRQKWMMSVKSMNWSSVWSTS